MRNVVVWFDKDLLIVVDKAELDAVQPTCASEEVGVGTSHLIVEVNHRAPFQIVCTKRHFMTVGGEGAC